MKGFRKGSLVLVIMLGLSSLSPIVSFAATDIENNGSIVEEATSEIGTSEEVVPEKDIESDDETVVPDETTVLEEETVSEEVENIEDVVELEQPTIQEAKPTSELASRTFYLPAVQLKQLNSNDHYFSGNGSKSKTTIMIAVEAPNTAVKNYQTISNSDGQFYYYFGETLPVGTKITVYQSNFWTSSVKTSIWVSAYVNPKPDPNPIKPVLIAPTIGEVTEDSTNISGNTTPNVSVQLKIAGDIYRTVSDASGKFLITLDEHYSAGSIIEVYAYDSLANKSATTLASVLAGRMSLGIDYITSQDRVISGNTAASMYVEVLVGNRVYSGYSDLSGKFNIPLSVSYKAGTSVLVTVSNIVTNQSVQMNTVIYPARPNVNYVMQGSNKITGIADPGAFVTVSVADGNKISTLANAAGYYELIVNPLYTTQGKTLIISQMINNMTSQEVEYTIN